MTLSVNVRLQHPLTTTDVIGVFICVLQPLNMLHHPTAVKLGFDFNTGSGPCVKPNRCLIF
jgi:hypothetical protein